MYKLLASLMAVCTIAGGACGGGDDEPRVGAPGPEQVLTEPPPGATAPAGEPAPTPFDDNGYWSRISFKLLGLDTDGDGQLDCGLGGEAYPCYYPLRSGPDFRADITRAVTKGWPLEDDHWVWVECQTPGNGVPNQGELRNSQGQTSNRWNLVRLGTGIFAWGNDIWFTDKGPLDSKAQPKFGCDKDLVPSRPFDKS